jgi:hypothetical protein
MAEAQHCQYASFLNFQALLLYASMVFGTVVSVDGYLTVFSLIWNSFSYLWAFILRS